MTAFSTIIKPILLTLNHSIPIRYHGKGRDFLSSHSRYYSFCFLFFCLRKPKKRAFHHLSNLVSFENQNIKIKSLDRRTTYKTMEANDHAFSHEARNWGWAQYWRRNDAYYSNPSVSFCLKSDHPISSHWQALHHSNKSIFAGQLTPILPSRRGIDAFLPIGKIQ